MPKIPVYQRQVGKQQRQIQPANVQIQPTQAQFGTAEAQATQNFGGTISKIGEILAHKKNRDDKQAALDLSTTFNLGQQDMLNNYKEETYTSESGEILTRPIGLMNRKLRQANGSTIDYEGKTQIQIEELLKDQNEDVAGIARNLMMSTYTSNRGQLRSHEGTQYQLDKELSLNTNLNSIQTNIVSNPSPDNYDVQSKQGRGAIVASYQGVLGEDATQAKVQEFNDDTMDKTVGSLLDTNSYADAQVLLDTNKDDLSAETYNELNATINKGKYLEVADNIFNSGLSNEDQLKEVDKIKNTALLGDVRKEVLFKQKQEQTFEKKEQSKYEDDQWRIMYTNPFTYNLDQQIDKVDPKTYKTMEKYRDDKLKEANGAVTPQNWGAYEEYMTIDINKLKNTDFSEIVTSVKDEKKINDIMNRRIKGDSEKTFRTRKFLKQGTDIMNTSKALGGKKRPSKLSIKYKKRRNAFMEEYSNIIAVMPEKDRTEKNIGNMGRELVFTQTASDRKIRNRAIKNPPPTLSKVTGLNFDVTEEVYYVDYGKKRRLYDPDGNFIVEGNIPI